MSEQDYEDARVEDLWPPLVTVAKHARHAATSEVDRMLLERARQARIERELAEKERIYEAYGDGAQYDDGDVLAFSKTFGAKMYRYAVIMAAGKWYVTGARSPQGVTWDELRVWLVSGTPVRFVVLMVPAK